MKKPVRWGPHSRFTALRFLVLPRPQGLQHKGIFFWFGYLIALPLSSEPTGLLLLRSVLYFVIVELLLQQAKFLLNDLRDRGDDQRLARNADRMARGMVQWPARFLLVLVIIRWGAALILGWLVSGSLFVVLVAISLHQLLYEAVLKPQARQHPVLFLFVLCLNLPLRVLSGYTAVTSGLSFGNGYLLLPLFVFYLLSWSSLSNLYFTEARSAANSASDPETLRWFSVAGLRAVIQGEYVPPVEPGTLRAQSPFFLENGKPLSAIALYPSVLIVTLFTLTFRTGWIADGNGWLDFLLIVLFGVATCFAPATIRGMRKRSQLWKRLLPAVHLMGFSLVALMAVLAIGSRTPYWSAWLLFVHTVHHYFSYVEEPNFAQ